ncbi:MAG: hypothetical protein ACPF8V_02055, partial [Luteibaculum sp.]
FKPQLALIHNMGWGENEGGTENPFSAGDMRKGYHESGVLIDNVLRLKYLDLFYLGFGAGLYYRHGAYELPEFKDNLNPTLSIIITTR